MPTFWNVVENVFGWNWWFLGTLCKGVKIIVNCKPWPFEKMLQRRFHILWITLGMISSWALAMVKLRENTKGMTSSQKLAIQIMFSPLTSMQGAIGTHDWVMHVMTKVLTLINIVMSNIWSGTNVYKFVLHNHLHLYYIL